MIVVKMKISLHLSSNGSKNQRLICTENACARKEVTCKIYLADLNLRI